MLTRFFNFLLLLTSLHAIFLAIETPPSQVAGLELLYNSTNGENWNWQDEELFGPKWSFSFPQLDPCNDTNTQWQGIACSFSFITGESEIVSLSLRSYGLNGSLPDFFPMLTSLTLFEISNSPLLFGSISDAISSLSNLQNLTLSDNGLTKYVPSSLSTLQNLQLLNLSMNAFTGEISPQLGSLTQLRVFDFSSNRLWGTLPHEFGRLSQLKYLSGHSNDFSGVFPVEFCLLSQLLSCDLSFNHLNGSLPSQLSSLSNLIRLDLSGNRLNGTLPVEHGNFTQLEHLDLHSNRLTGSLPSQLSSSPNLSSLDLSGNRINGSIPVQFRSLTSLLRLDLDFNHLTGSLPSQLSSLSNLIRLDLSGNRLNGTLPVEYGNFTQLEHLDLHSNRLTGSLPSLFGSLFRVIRLDLSGNRLNGTLPVEYGNLTSLESFDLHRNRLTGSLPSQLSSLPNLRSLDLSANLLQGSIPTVVENAGFVKLRSLDLHGNLFTGILPWRLDSFANLTRLDLSDNRLNGSIPVGDAAASFVKLRSLDLHGNLLTGMLPWRLDSFANLSSLDLSDNRLHGSIPVQFGNLIHLKYFDLSSNRLTNSIPAEFGHLDDLMYLGLSRNQLTGPIPSQFSSLTSLNALNLSSNNFNGSIQSAVFEPLTRLGYLHLSYNHFSGVFPLVLTSLPSLFYLGLRNNKLEGSIPPEIGSLTTLGHFYGDDNSFTGPIPFNISSLKDLRTFSCSINSLTSSLPLEISLLRKLTLLHLSENRLTGSIPSSLINLKKLKSLHLQSNRLKGTLDFQLKSFPLLEQFFVQKNRLHGTLRNLFSTPPQDVPWSSILYFDVSDNLFSGSIPSELFHHTSLKTISLSLNCFRHEIPSTICESYNATVISMAGLGAADRCPNAIQLPITDVSLGQILTGSIPECLWLLSNLETLNLAGNGLTGTISKVSSMHSLSSLTLSHNYLSGTIPTWVQKKNLTLLDLSHNKLSGEINDLAFQVENSTLELQVNRLSGHLARSFDHYSYLDILAGNIFGCDNLPPNDENIKYYSCGSTEYNQAMVLSVVITGLVCLLMSFYWIAYLFVSHDRGKSLPVCCSAWIERRYCDYEVLLQYLKYHVNNSLPAEPDLSSNVTSIRFGCLLFDLMKSICLLTLLWIFFSLPISILKFLDLSSDNPHYKTHENLYQWTWSLAFISGYLPVIFILILTLACLIGFCALINQIHLKYPPPSPFVPKTKTKTFPLLTPTHTQIVWLIFICNLLLVGTLNSVYLFSTLRDLSTNARIGTQVGFACATLLWNFSVRGLLETKIKESRYGIWLFVIMHLLNSVVIPCLGTALSSPTCYQRLIVEPRSITSTYPFRECVHEQINVSGSVCLEYSLVDMDPLSITPPFTYSYQCFSTLLTSYIPVYLYSISLQFIVLLIRSLLIFNTRPSQYPASLFKTFPGVFWPLHWNSSTHAPSSVRLIRPAEIICTTFNHLIIFMTFGLCSPVLGCFIILFVCVDLSSWQMLVGRFLKVRLSLSRREVRREVTENAIHRRLETISPVFTLTEESLERSRKNLSVDPFISLLNEQLEPITNYLTVCKRPVVVTSCLFFTLLRWELVADIAGFQGAVWVPVTGVAMLFLIWIVDRWLIRFMMSDTITDHLTDSFSCMRDDLPSIRDENSLMSLELRPSQSFRFTHSSRPSEYSANELPKENE